jgi:hypothetical protein
MKRFAPDGQAGPLLTTFLSAKGWAASATTRWGGWYRHRASKAALNQLVKTAAIDTTQQSSLCVSLHQALLRLPNQYVCQNRPERAAQSEPLLSDLLRVLRMHCGAADTNTWSVTRAPHYRFKAI